MQNYLDLLAHILKHGGDKSDRTGTGTKSVFGYQMRFNLQQGFPILTTKKVHFASVVHELLWFLSGSTTTDYLKQHNVRIWDEWATTEQTAKFGRLAGDLGPIYGHQWRNFGASTDKAGRYNDDGIDQIAQVVDMIKTTPDSRRLIVSGWNPKEADKVALPPCHTLFQFFVHDNKLSCQLYQRSADVFLGVPFNIASYALLTHMIAACTGLGVGDFIWTAGDAHLYQNHITQAKTQLLRTPLALPTLHLNPEIKCVFDYTFDDIMLQNYTHHPAIKAKVSV